MYSIYARKGEERICVYNDSYQLEETTLIDPKLELSESLAGTFKAKLPAKNNGYEFIERLNTEIIIYKNKKEIWSGRVIKEDTDFWKNRSIECEGELAYLNDTTQPQAEYTDISVSRLLQTFLDIHNTKAPDDKKFSLGIVTVSKDIELVLSNYESTLEAIGNFLIKNFGGFLRIRKVDGIRYLDYIREQDRETSSQIIQFGRNLLDFTKTYDATEFCTVLLPLGGRLTEEDGSSASDIEGLEAYVTVEEVNEGSPYVVNADTIEEFGWIEKKVTWNDIEEPSELMTKAVEYLEEVQFDDMELEVNAVDLGYLESDFDNINLSEKVKVISSVHGLNKFFPVKKISIPINDPAHTTFTMGTAVKTNFTVRTNNGTGYVEDLIDDIPSESEILNYAKRNATALIKSNTTGFITITQRDNGTNELYITDVKISDGYDPEDPSKEASRYWVWNLDGLGYFNREDITPQNPEGLKLALTMDGAIVADFITTGTLTAEVIKTGILRGYDNQDNWWNLKTGELHIKMGSVDGLSTKFEVVEGKITSEVTRATTAEGTLRSSITQTAEAITSEVTRASAAEGNLSSRITQNANSITSEVTRASTAEGNLSSRITQTANAISSEVTRASGVENSLSSRITQTATEVSSKVSAGEVSSMISQSADSIRLKASNIVVSSTNFNVDSSGNMSCSNASISGNITVGYNYGSIEIKDAGNNSGLFIDSYGIHSQNDELNIWKDNPYGGGNWYFSISNNSGSVFIGDGNIQLSKSIDISTPVVTRSGYDVYTGYTGLVGYRAQNNDRTNMRFVNGILVEKDVHT